jgi:hypothetical protein
MIKKFRERLERTKGTKEKIILTQAEMRWLLNKIEAQQEKIEEYVALIDPLARELSELRGDYK